MLLQRSDGPYPRSRALVLRASSAAKPADWYQTVLKCSTITKYAVGD